MIAAAMDADTTPDDGTAAAALDWLLRRYSVPPKHLLPPGPTPDELALAVRLAGRAPDHEQLRPWRFVWIPDPRRAALAELFARDAAQRGTDVQHARDKAFAGPALLALLVRLREDVAEVPAHEQWIAAGGALANLLNALHLLGYAGKTLSGASVRGEAVRAAFEQPGERLVAWIALGTPTRHAHPRASAGQGLHEWPPLSRWD